jgi:transposase
VEFESKAADIIGLYLNPPQHAAVFSVDEKTAIQALDRLDPVLPLSPGRAERHGFEYCPPHQQIHIILDNLSAHKTALVHVFLEQNPRVRFHFTPTYSSWLNQVELWFVRIERDVIARGVFTSVPDLARKPRRYINAYSANARPIQWKYSDPSRRIRSNDLSATGH